LQEIPPVPHRDGPLTLAITHRFPRRGEIKGVRDFRDERPICLLVLQARRPLGFGLSLPLEQFLHLFSCFARRRRGAIVLDKVLEWIAIHKNGLGNVHFFGLENATGIQMPSYVALSVRIVASCFRT